MLLLDSVGVLTMFTERFINYIFYEIISYINNYKKKTKNKGFQFRLTYSNNTMEKYIIIEEQGSKIKSLNVVQYDIFDICRERHNNKMLEGKNKK
jgi:hypothetical protein